MSPEHFGCHWLRLRVVLSFFALGWVAQVRATTVVPPEFSELVNGSDYIVHAVVKNVAAEKRANTSGNVRIVTLVELDVIEVVAGTPSEKVVLELLGGKIGDEELRVVGAPQFKVGDEDILFVSGNGRTVSPLYAMMHGRYAVQKEAATGRRYVARADGRPLRDTSEVAMPMAEGATGEILRRQSAMSEGLEPGDFIRRIRANVQPNSRLLRAR